MKNRRDFLRNTFGVGATLAAAPHLFAARQASGADMDTDHMSHGVQRGSRIVSVETPDVPELPWRMAGGAKEFHLIAEPVKQELIPGKIVNLWGYNGSAPGPTIQVNQATFSNPASPRKSGSRAPHVIGCCGEVSGHPERLAG